MTKLRAFTVPMLGVLVAMAMVLAACAGTKEAKPAREAGAAPSGVVTPADGKLVITGGEQGGKNLFFDNKAQIPVGQEITIEFQNKGKVIHNLVVQGTNFKSEQVVAGGKTSTFKVKIDKAGSYKFICEYHLPEMTGTLTVK